jgi:hypothetical protein
LPASGTMLLASAARHGIGIAALALDAFERRNLRLSPGFCR